MEDPQLANNVAGHLVLEDESPEPVQEDVVASTVNETWRDGRVVVWTDGAGRRNQDRRLRRSGVGVYYGEDHAKNVAVALSGRDQTNQRAELMAIILAVERETRPLWVRSDIAYCVDGVLSARAVGRRLRGDNSDL